MDIGTLLGSTVIATFFSGLVSFIVSRRQENLQYITAERKEWREKIREIACRLDGASYKETLKILTELKVRINAFGNREVSRKYVDDAHIWELINDLENQKPDQKTLIFKQKQLIEYISLLLKYDWERSKNEVKGNVYDAMSLIIFLMTAIYFTVSIFISNENVNITKFQLVSMVGAYIFIIIIINVVFLAEVRISCKGILNGVISVKTDKNSYKRLLVCYILWILSDIGLFALYAFSVCKFFVLVGNGNFDVWSVFWLMLMYLFGMGLQYVSQTLEIDKEYNYIKAINNIRLG